MTLKRFTERELLDGLDAHAAHADELANPFAHESVPPEPRQIKITNQHGVAALRWIFEHQNELGLSRQDVMELAGAKTEKNINEWLSEEEPVPESSMRRLGLILGIYKCLVGITPSGHEKLAFEWFQRNTTIFPDFSGLSLRSYLLRNPTEKALNIAYFKVRSLSR